MEEKGWLETKRYVCRKCGSSMIIESSGIRYWECTRCHTVNYEENYLENKLKQELGRAREEWTEELRQAFYDTFYKSGELWFDYIFEDGDTKAEQNAKEVVEDYWKEIISKLTTK